VAIVARSFHDLSVFENSNVSELNLDGTSVTDLSPLRDMPLLVLSAANTGISDLRPLGNLPLRVLHIGSTLVKDLSTNQWPVSQRAFHRPLAPISWDYAPLAKLLQLRKLTLTPEVPNILMLQALPHLERLGYRGRSEIRNQSIQRRVLGKIPCSDWETLTALLSFVLLGRSNCLVVFRAHEGESNTPASMTFPFRSSWELSASAS
jgi:hypothetical protein